MNKLNIVFVICSIQKLPLNLCLCHCYYMSYNCGLIVESYKMWLMCNIMLYLSALIRKQKFNENLYYIRILVHISRQEYAIPFYCDLLTACSVLSI